MSRLRRVVVVAVAAVAASLVGAGVASADSISATCSWGGQSQPCSSSTWYPSEVSVVWQPDTPPSSPPTGCTFDVTSGYDTDQVSTITCSASWSDGTTVTKQYTLHIETSNPTASAVLARGPDSNGWYNHPVGISFIGSAFSGIASCTPGTTFAGPNMMNAVISGSCTDYAGKVASASASLNYDSSPPALQAAATAGDKDVRLSWQTANVVSLTISRSPGTHGAADSVIHENGDGTFNDTHVKNGVRYVYTITAQDTAGNVTSRTLQAVPGVRLLSPLGGAMVSSPPLLTWTSVLHASYYNVQLYRGARKVLSAWPSHPSLSLGRSWLFGGHRYRLKPGHYHWYVWPGFGSRRGARYGSLIGTGTFGVARSP
jgi:hypothetical protein